MSDLSNIDDIEYLSIGIASPEEIYEWSHGEVTEPETLNYRTQRPEKNGLFSEKIFGPTKDYQCYCGKYKKVRYKGIVCERCGVEVTHSRVRRERMGHIDLATPVVHLWFLKTMRSKLGTLLGVSVSKLEQVVYYSAYIVTEVSEEERQKAMDMVEKEYKSRKEEAGSDEVELKEARDKSMRILRSLEVGMIMSEEDQYLLSKKFGNVFEAGRGGSALRKILKNMDLEELSQELEENLESTDSKNKRKKILRRYKLVESFLKSGVKPEWMILEVLPVMPPDLRPMVALDGGRYATNDVNDLYRRVINRNNRLKELKDLNSPDVILTNEKRMLQEAVDALIDNTRGSGKQVMSSNRRPLKSLADILKGKQGRFRRNLLGKRVDYSGRSVIVIGPDLELDECGLPKELALEIFRPFVINKILEEELAFNIKQANNLIDKKVPEVWAILEDVISDKRVLLNRAPTLHRLGIQAFKPVLTEDLAIQVHPLVCPPFNADFDGDQMAVHLPLSEEAQYESEKLMDASKNLLKPASGEPIAKPSQDIVLGCYYLTGVEEDVKGEGKALSGYSEAVHAYEADKIHLRAKIRVPIEEGEVKETTFGRLIFNEALPDSHEFINKQLDKSDLSDVVYEIIDAEGIEDASEYLDKVKDIGFSYSTDSSISFGMADTVIPDEKEEIVEEVEEKMEKVDSQFEQGLLTKEEWKSRLDQYWTEARDKIGDLVPEVLEEYVKDNGEFNSIYPIIDSGSRGSWGQSNQIMGIRGLVTNPQQEIIELPIKSSYKEGMGTLEYFIATHGARKGLTDTALKTAESGYLTRRLVDVAQDLVIKKRDCRTTEGIKIIREEGESYEYSFSDRLYSRTSLEDIEVDGEVVVEEGEVIDRESADIVGDSEIEEVEVRSPVTCKTSYGICSECYGWDLTTEEPVKDGEAVGVVAAQSIGEPGTQLTMRTFHKGGVAGVDITHGLPRIEEVFEVREPKGKAIMSEVDGRVETISEKTSGKMVKVREEAPEGEKGKLHSYSAQKGVKLYVEEGDEVEEGEVLSEGPLDLEEILQHRGIEELRRYIINEVQKVYVPEGSTINDKHIEIIVRKMLSRLKVEDPGDTDLTRGELVEKSKLREENRKVRREGGGSRAKYNQEVMGITKVSLTTESFLSAASFQETSRVLVDAAVQGKKDELRGLKENVIVGKLIPAGTGKRGIPKSAISKEE
ncbi:MAG: DNA-directed RNA polymerase subunit beta' [Candidatus Magasanikbacteria bacterium]